MASVSSTIVSFKPSCNYSLDRTSQGNGRMPSIVTLGWTKKSFPTLRTSRLRISCAAKPETIDKVCDIVKKQLALSADTEVTADTTFAKLGADSLDTVEIVMALEEEFGITVEEDNAQNITNIQEAAEVIDKLVEQK